MEKNFIDIIECFVCKNSGKINYFHFTTFLNNLSEEQFYCFLKTLINFVRQGIIDADIFDFISLDRNNDDIEICLKNINFSYISIDNLVKFLQNNKNLKIIFDSCVFSNNFIDYFINRKLYDGLIKLKNNIVIDFEKIILRNANLLNVKLEEFERMIENKFLVKQCFQGCCISDNVLSNDRSSNILLGIENGIFKYINLSNNSYDCIKKLINDNKIQIIDNKKLLQNNDNEKLILNRDLIKIIMRAGIKNLGSDKDYLEREKGDLSNLNLSGLDLTNIDFKNLKDIRETKLKNTKLDRKQIELIIKSGTKDFYCVDISEQNFSSDYNKKSIDLSDCVFAGANLNKTRLCGANLSNVDFSSASMFETNFKNADITGANFENAKMKNVKFDIDQLKAIFNGDIKGIDKREANGINIVKLKGKDLRSLDFTDVNIKNFVFGCEFIRLIVQGKIKGIEKGNLSELNLRGLSLKNQSVTFNKDTNLTNTNLKGVILDKKNVLLMIKQELKGRKKGNLSEINLRDIDIETIDFTGVNLNQVKINRDQVKLIINNKVIGRNHNDLSNLDLSNINLTNIDFSGKDLTNTNLNEAIVDHDFVKLILNGQLIGRERGDLSNLKLRIINKRNSIFSETDYLDISDLVFYENINLTNTNLYFTILNKELVKLIFNGKTIGREKGDLSCLNLKNMDLSDLDFSLYPVNMSRSNLHNTILSPNQIKLILNGCINGVSGYDLLNLNSICYADISEYNFSESFLIDLFARFNREYALPQIKVNEKQAQILLKLFFANSNIIYKLNLDITSVDLSQLNIDWQVNMFKNLKLKINLEQVKLILNNQIKNLNPQDYKLFDTSSIDKNQLNFLIEQQKYKERSKLTFKPVFKVINEKPKYIQRTTELVFNLQQVAEDLKLFQSLPVTQFPNNFVWHNNGIQNTQIRKTNNNNNNNIQQTQLNLERNNNLQNENVQLNSLLNNLQSSDSELCNDKDKNLKK